LPDKVLGHLNVEGIAGAASVVGQRKPSFAISAGYSFGFFRIYPPEVDAAGKTHQVSSEAISPDM